MWIDHFRHGNGMLGAVLAADRVLVHPLVIGELACGSLPDRARTLGNLGLLRTPVQATAAEVLGLTERERLHGLGCGWIDLALLTSCRLSPGGQSVDPGCAAARAGRAFRPRSAPERLNAATVPDQRGMTLVGADSLRLQYN